MLYSISYLDWISQDPREQSLLFNHNAINLAYFGWFHFGWFQCFEVTLSYATIDRSVIEKNLPVPLLYYKYIEVNSMLLV